MRLIIAFLLFAALVAAGAGFLLLSRGDAPEALVQAELVGVKFSYARAYARDEGTGAGGLADRLSFVALFPSFTPLPSKNSGAAQAVTLTVTPKDDSLDPAERPAKLYARFLTAETHEGPGGLISRNFEPSSPYDLEQLFIAPPDGRTFFARCPKTQQGAPSEGCLSMFRQGAVDVELRYPAALLDHWLALVNGAHGLLSRMTAVPPRRKRP